MRQAALQLWDPFLLDIVVRGRIDDGEADQKHISVGVGERPQLVVVLLWEKQRVCTAWVRWVPCGSGSDTGNLPL